MQHHSVAHEYPPGQYTKEILNLAVTNFTSMQSHGPIMANVKYLYVRMLSILCLHYIYISVHPLGVSGCEPKQRKQSNTTGKHEGQC